jgi:hypothetical protein
VVQYVRLVADVYHPDDIPPDRLAWKDH